MSLVIGWAEPDGAVHLSGDRYVGDEWASTVAAEPKIFMATGAPVAVGVVGSVAVWNALRYRMQLPPPFAGQPPADYMCRCVVDAVREALDSAGQLQTEHGLQSSYGVALFGFAGRLWQMGSDFAVVQAGRAYDAVGAGELVALGALEAMSMASDYSASTRRKRNTKARSSATGGLPVQAVLSIAMLAASEHSDAVRPKTDGTFDYLTLPIDDE